MSKTNLRGRWSDLASGGILGVSQRINVTGLPQYIGIDSTGCKTFFTLTHTEPAAWAKAGPIVTTKKYLEASHEWYLGLTLTDSQFSHEFVYLCEDLVNKVEGLTDEHLGLQGQKNAYEDWIEFFKRSRELGSEAIRGLFCEIWFFYQQLLNDFDQDVLTEAWVGPFGAPQDFVMPSFSAVEIKSVQPAGTKVRIANEHQLAFEGELRLQVYRLQEVFEANRGQTLNELVNSLMARLNETNSVKVALKIAKVGNLTANDLADKSRFEVVDSLTYDASTAGFPKITPKTLPLGVSNVKYELSLGAIEGFKVDSSGV
jgi:hypothetical protein